MKNHVFFTRIMFNLSFALLLLGSTNTFSAPVEPGFDLYSSLPGGIFFHPTLGSIPIQPGESVGPGNTDIILERLQGFNLSIDQKTTIEVRMNAFSMDSLSPIDVGGSLFDVHINSIFSPLGTMTVQQNTTDGGTYAYNVPVNFQVTFLDITNSSNTFSEDLFDIFAPSGQWSHTPGLNNGYNMMFPSGGGLWGNNS